MESVREILFNAFVEGKISRDEGTYSKVAEEFAKLEEKIDNGEFNPDDLGCFQYEAMREGFYAGMNAMRALITG